MRLVTPTPGTIQLKNAQIDLYEAAVFIRNKCDLSIRNGIEFSKRVEYFRGKRLFSVLEEALKSEKSNALKKNLKIECEEDITKLVKGLLEHRWAYSTPLVILYVR